MGADRGNRRHLSAHCFELVQRRAVEPPGGRPCGLPRPGPRHRAVSRCGRDRARAARQMLSPRRQAVAGHGERRSARVRLSRLALRRRGLLRAHSLADAGCAAAPARAGQELPVCRAGCVSLGVDRRRGAAGADRADGRVHLAAGDAAHAVRRDARHREQSRLVSSGVRASLDARTVLPTTSWPASPSTPTKPA